MAVVDLQFWKIRNVVNILLLAVILKVYGGNTHRRRTSTTEPTFLPTEQNITVFRGELATLRCRILNLGPRMVAWRKVPMDYPLTVGSMTFEPKEDITVTFKKMKKRPRTQYDLNIKRAQPRHSGKYECQISSSDVYVHHVNLKVLDQMKTVEKIPPVIVTGTTVVDLYQKINLTCTATGKSRAPEDIDWFHDSHVIQTHDPKWRDKIVIYKYKPEVPGKTLVSNLIIDVSQEEHGGRYLCRSSDKETAFIEVNILVTPRSRLSRHPPGGNTETLSVKDSAGDRTILNPVLCFVMLISCLISR